MFRRGMVRVKFVVVDAYIDQKLAKIYLCFTA